MTDSIRERGKVVNSQNELSLVMLGTALLRHRRKILALGVVGAAIGLASAVVPDRVYSSWAVFVPQSSDNGQLSGLAAAASQFGIRVPTTSSDGWGPPLYVALLTSPELLAPIAHDTVRVTEEGGRVTTVMDLLKVKGPTAGLREDAAVRALQRMVNAQEVKTLGTVNVAVTSKWPSVSFQLAERLVAGVNRFNVEQRQTQAGAERRFVDTLSQSAETALRAAEDRLMSFREQNRTISSPELQLESERLERDVSLRQQVYTSLLQSREDARIREIRDTPVITVLESPRLPVRPEARRSLLKTLLGGIVGVTLGVLIALIARAFAQARRAPNEDTEEFLQLVDQATPRFLRRQR